MDVSALTFDMNALSLDMSALTFNMNALTFDMSAFTFDMKVIVLGNGCLFDCVCLRWQRIDQKVYGIFLFYQHNK